MTHQSLDSVRLSLPRAPASRELGEYEQVLRLEQETEGLLSQQLTAEFGSGYRRLPVPGGRP